MSLDNFEYISWEKFHALSFSLAKKLEKKYSEVKFDKIIAISRGGLVLSRILSDFLNLPISHISIQAYYGIGQMKKPQITEGVSVSLYKLNLLLVDEIVDSGRSLVRAKRYLKNFAPKNIISAALIAKPLASPKPNLAVYTTNKWVIFPYEIRETVEELTKIWQKEKVSKTKILARFKKLNLPIEMTENYFSDDFY